MVSLPTISLGKVPTKLISGDTTPEVGMLPSRKVTWPTFSTAPLSHHCDETT